MPLSHSRVRIVSWLSPRGSVLVPQSPRGSVLVALSSVSLFVGTDCRGSLSHLQRFIVPFAVVLIVP